MPRKFFQKYLPSHEAILNNRHIARFGTLFLHPNLWHINRRSVSGGVAAGMFAGLVPGTNPLTIGPIYVIAYWIGTLLVPGDSAPFTHPPGFDWSNLGAWLRALLEWSLSLGKPLAVGLVALAVGFAIAGYVVVQLAWRAHVILAWRGRKARRAGRDA